jgi:uncharacterized protein YcfJ
MKILVIPLMLLGITLSGCISNPNTLALGALGAGAGGFAGSKFGGGQGRILATAGGTALGGLIGAFVGNKFDQTNQNASSIQQMYQRQRIGYDGVPAPVVYQMPYQQQQQQQNHTVPLTCRIQNNYVTCGSN